jgi:hypothetical protein
MASKKPKASQRPTKAPNNQLEGISGRQIIEQLNASWTSRPDALEILVKCATLIRGLDALDPESSGRHSLTSAAIAAVELINACELALKKEGLRSAERVKEQEREIVESARIPGPMNFDEGVQFLLDLADRRPNRVEKALQTLLQEDFTKKPRRPRELEPLRRIQIGGPIPLCPERFVKVELAWYRKKGFSSDDLIRLKSLR